MRPWFNTVQHGLAEVQKHSPMGRAAAESVLKVTEVPQESQEAVIARYYRWAGLFAAPILTYHGFKRTESVGWAVAWSAFGAVAPFLALPLAFSQGFGKKKV